MGYARPVESYARPVESVEQPWRGSRCWRKTLARYGEAGPKRALCVEVGTKGQDISRTDSYATPAPPASPQARGEEERLCSCPSLTRSNPRGTDPYARWCGRGAAARRP